MHQPTCARRLGGLLYFVTRRPIPAVLAFVAGVLIMGCGGGNVIVPPPLPSSGAPRPAVTGISPIRGPAVGGTKVVIIGSGFAYATQVLFGKSSARMKVRSDSMITATSPPGHGTVDITIVTGYGNSAANIADQFIYIRSPASPGPS